MRSLADINTYTSRNADRAAQPAPALQAAIHSVTSYPDRVYRGTAAISALGILFGGLLYTCDCAVKEDWFWIARLIGSWRVECGYDPALVDEIILFPGEAKPIRARLERNDVWLTGCSWPEAAERIAARAN